MDTPHIPVLLNETINLLNIRSNGIYVDMTLGRGGHSSEILKSLKEKGLLISIDQDDEAIEYAKNKFQGNGNIEIVRANFKDIDKVLKKFDINQVDGIIFDLGVSSPQFDEPERGFSYNFLSSKLDMRMNRENTLTAEYIVNHYSFKDLVRIFKEYGEEKFSSKIAHNIVKQRTLKPIENVGELVEIIKKSKPSADLSKKGHPAKQIFQALRIEVNDELNSLKEAITKSLSVVKVGGRIAIISFQSLEDRIVKDAFKEVSIVVGNRYNFETKDDKPSWKMITKKPIVPSEEELLENHRAQSAKLRVIERIL